MNKEQIQMSRNTSQQSQRLSETFAPIVKTNSETFSGIEIILPI